MLANPEVSVALVSLDKKPTGFSIHISTFDAPPQKLKINE